MTEQTDVRLHIEGGVKQADLLALQEDTPPDEIKWRDGPGGKRLAYVDARYVMERLDETLGPANWSRKHLVGPNGKVACGIGILVEGVGWVEKWDGAGETDIEGEKGSFSDSFKRAAVSWGVGRDLYSIDKPAQAPRPAQRQDDEDYGQYADPDPAVRQAQHQAAVMSSQPGVQQARVYGSDDGSVCPIHHKPWTNGQYGWFCKSKAGPNEPQNQRGYCTAKPSKAWVARQELAS